MGNVNYGFSATHPGEVLKDEIEYRNISQTVLAKVMGISYKILNDILNCRRPITTTTALLFEAVLDVPAYSLINLQMKYNMQTALHDDTLVNKINNIKKERALQMA